MHLVLAPLILPGAFSAAPTAPTTPATQAAIERRVTHEIASPDLRSAAWAAFEARTLGLRGSVDALTERLRRTVDDVDPAGDGALRSLQLGLFDALLTLDAPLAPDDAARFHAIAPWPTLLMLAREPDADFLNELRGDHRTRGKVGLEWLAVRLLLVRERDADYASWLLESVTPRLCIEVVDPPRPGPHLVRCGGATLLSGRMLSDEFTTVPDDFPPTASWSARLHGRVGMTQLVAAAGFAVHLDRRLHGPGEGGGGGSTGPHESAPELERAFLAAYARAGKEAELAVSGTTRRHPWAGQPELDSLASEVDDRFEGLRQRLVARVCEGAGLHAEAFPHALEPERVVVRRTTDDTIAFVAPSGWDRR